MPRIACSSGVHTSGTQRRASSGNVCAAGTTPTIVYVSPFRSTVPPTADGLPPNRVFQSASERTATRWPGSSSPATRVRPSRGRTRRTEKKSGATTPATTSSGRPEPVSARSSSPQAAIDSKTPFSRFQSR